MTVHLPLPRKKPPNTIKPQNKTKKGGGGGWGTEKTPCQKLLKTLVLCGAPRMSLLNELGRAGGFLTLKCDCFGGKATKGPVLVTSKKMF